MDGMAQILDYSRFWWTNDTLFTELWRAVPTARLTLHFEKTKTCAYCLQPMEEVISAGIRPTHENSEGRGLNLWGCPGCGWWFETFHKYDIDWPDWNRIRRRVPFLREFAVEDRDVPLGALGRELACRPEIVHGINTGRFEHLVAGVLSDFRDVDVEVVGRTADGGIDLLYVDGDKPFAVQVKRRESPTSKESVTLVREFLGACLLKPKTNIRGAKIVTTASSFTKPAREAAARTTALGLFDVYELVDRDRFFAMFRQTSLNHQFPWFGQAMYWKGVYRDISTINERLLR